MPKKKASNTSKTAHVMNLISKNRETALDSPAEATPEAPPAAPPPPVSATPSPILPSLNADVAITSQIKSALEDLVEDMPAPEEAELPAAPELRQETEPAPESAVAASVSEKAQDTGREPEAERQATPPAPEPSVHATEPDLVTVPNEEAVVLSDEPAALTKGEQEGPAREEEPVTEEVPPVSSAADPDQTSCINIMQALVEESVDRYIKMFGLCDCPRCVADVKALALNNLVPKYVVAVERERSPRVIIYNERYHAEVTAQILRACKTVMDNPLHNKE